MINSFEDYINDYFASFEDNRIVEAMKYSMSGGKRFRPNIIFKIVEGFNVDVKKAYSCALALEMIQTYSLIHDDLPAMDNDDLRRGKPTCHKQFGEDIAILTGDSLLTHAFSVIASSNYDPIIKCDMVDELSKYSGLDGMIYGQLLDVENNLEHNIENLSLIETNKTGGLFKIACLFGMHLCNIDDKEFFIELGNRIGVIYQLYDDLMDATSNEEIMGKSLSDVDNNKFTALSIYSINELKTIIKSKLYDFDNFVSKYNDLVDLKNFIHSMVKF